MTTKTTNGHCGPRQSTLHQILDFAHAYVRLGLSQSPAIDCMLVN